MFQMCEETSVCAVCFWLVLLLLSKWSGFRQLQEQASLHMREASFLNCWLIMLKRNTFKAPTEKEMGAPYFDNSHRKVPRWLLSGIEKLGLRYFNWDCSRVSMVPVGGRGAQVMRKDTIFSKTPMHDQHRSEILLSNHLYGQFKVYTQ